MTTKGKKGDDSFYEMFSDDFDEIEETRTWNLESKLNVNTYNHDFLIELDAKEFSIEYLKKHGFKFPLVFKESKGLGLRVPSKKFTVEDVKRCVGSKRIIDVMDVNTQKAMTMTMKEWCEYYEDNSKSPRERLLNVISLEFSHTKLEQYVQSPTIVRQLDWIDQVWPQNLVASHTESTNILDKMKYPKVQKYCLMSVAGCYTDFHIDMGGSSVWYHLLKGEKVFWLIPPSDYNLERYEKWIKSGEQHKKFLADYVENCQRIVLQQGWTFMLPSGWIHAVYTPKDSIVFGGNFLHSFNLETQLKIVNIENKTRVPLKFRYPFFTEMMWYVVERYINYLTGHTYLVDLKKFHSHYGQKIYSNKSRRIFDVDIGQMTITHYELNGLAYAHQYLKALPQSKKQVPVYIVKPDDLLKRLKSVINYFTTKPYQIMRNDVPLLNKHTFEPTSISALENLQLIQTLESNTQAKYIEKHVNENETSNSNSPDRSIISFTGHSDEHEADLSNFINENSMNSEHTCVDNIVTNNNNNNNDKDLPLHTEVRKYVMRKLPRTKGSIRKRLRPLKIPRSNVERRRRIRCRRCEPCTRDDCGECKYCKDMKKFGGTGISKQCCLSKQCLNPLLPSTSVCLKCGMEIERNYSHTDLMSYECEICFEIYHAACFRLKYPDLADVECIINEDLLNSWQCANCIVKGYKKINDENNGEFKRSKINDEFKWSKMNDENYDTDNKSILKSIIYDDTHKDTDDELTINSLTDEQKQLILSEFCEILNNYSDNDEINENEDVDVEYFTSSELNKSSSISSLNNKNKRQYYDDTDFNNNNKRLKFDETINFQIKHENEDDIYWKPLF